MQSHAARDSRHISSVWVNACCVWKTARQAKKKHGREECHCRTKNCTKGGRNDKVMVEWLAVERFDPPSNCQTAKRHRPCWGEAVRKALSRPKARLLGPCGTILLACNVGEPVSCDVGAAGKESDEINCLILHEATSQWSVDELSAVRNHVPGLRIRPAQPPPEFDRGTWPSVGHGMVRLEYSPFWRGGLNGVPYRHLHDLPISSRILHGALPWRNERTPD
ncbi:hypothetical protein EJ04DRAFT_520710 [Polyplosphaeria fusca]|uniref:Uncharacterized protein n=1 Tax=Polyplosphaeria fusca TaxID=682080 RepID=A0A9P4R1Y7_9PLEO|nr:hypothetical protein EJ04DRAFT_520710 [Polyplosphaeria fusca]